MSKEQQVQLDAILRQGQFDAGGDVPTLRAAFDAVMAQIPVPPDVQHGPVEIGGVAGVEVTINGIDAGKVILYFHGGVYVIGSAAATVALVGDLARRTGVGAITLDYRLAPEHPYPAAVDDARAAYEGLLARGFAPGQIALAGESAGGGLVVALLLALRDGGVPLPSCGYVMSPYVDLTLSGESLAAKRDADPLLSPEGLRARVPDYVGADDASNPNISPILADLRGLPPLLIQVGSNEVLLSDALRLAERAGLADVPVTLEVTPGVPHVFQAYAGMLAEGAVALDRAAAFLIGHFDSKWASSRQEIDVSDWNTQIIEEFRANEGRVGGAFEGAPMILLHHRGRTSGREYVTPLMYLPHDTDQDTVYVFATTGGAPRNPDWYHNVTDAGRANIERGADNYEVTVRDLPGAERDEVYAEQARRYSGFAAYERQTSGVRVIPVLELTRP
jgi:monoterpene epsilon-lactone hydrolase